MGMLVRKKELDAALARRNVARDAGGRVLMKGHLFVLFGGEEVDVVDAVCLIDGQEVRLLDLPLDWCCPAVTIYAEEEQR